MTISELHPHLPVTSSSASRKALVLFYNEGERSRHQFASDAGVVPYENGFNDSNFTVLLEELIRDGVNFELEFSPEYLKRVKELNAIESDFDDFLDSIFDEESHY